MTGESAGLPPEGWYDDPQSGAVGAERWWNGHQWTAHTRVVNPPQPEQPGGVRPEPGPASVAQALRPATALPDGTPLAEVGPRIGAYVIDVVVVLVVGGIASAVVGIPLFLLLDDAPPGISWLGLGELLDIVVVGATWVVYQLLFRGSGTTLGKRLLHLRARPLEADGPLTTGQVLRRAVLGSGGVLCVVLPGGPLVGFLLLCFEAYRMSKNPLGRPWHDEVAGTVVIQTGR